VHPAASIETLISSVTKQDFKEFALEVKRPEATDEHQTFTKAAKKHRAGLARKEVFPLKSGETLERGIRPQTHWLSTPGKEDRLLPVQEKLCRISAACSLTADASPRPQPHQVYHWDRFQHLKQTLYLVPPLF